VDWARHPEEGTTIELLRYEPDRRSVRARFSGPDGQETVTGRVMLMGLVPTATRAIAAGEVIGPADLGELEVDLLDAHRDLVRGTDQALGRTARRALGPGRPILARDLKITPDVARNAIVTLEARVGAISLRARGKAIDGGTVGDTIRVQNIDSRKLLTGTIVEPGIVAVGG
jgi:flagella basal body P-ring formation protein FlgA